MTAVNVSRAPDEVAKHEAPTVLPEVVTLQRTVLPEDGDFDTLPLYVDGLDHPDLVLGRHRLRVPVGERSSFATYFNAFPASYWRRWTTVERVRLRVQVSGEAAIMVYQSNARGDLQRVALRRVAGDQQESTFELSLAPFGDGGWYWFDLVAGQGDAVLESAVWEATASPVNGRVTIGITTFNRPADCVALLESLEHSPEALSVIDRIVIVDQGNQLVAEQEGYGDVASRLGGVVDIVRQPNLGGSGGFARSMFEAAYRGSSDYVLLLDDDVIVEPEGILRAITFADLARSRTIVGGHMLNQHIRSMLHSFGEAVNRYRFFWGPVGHTEEAHDFAEESIKETEWLHRRTDVDYNGWWMCLIPTDVVRSIGLGMPMFIKWDDAEFGLRAQAAGVPTVSLPGAAVWHVPWTNKDDTIDWQAYHHARNRILAALLYSPYERGGRLVYESLLTQLKHGLSMQYSAAELRIQAIEDLLSGPAHMHESLEHRLWEIRQFRSTQDDAIVSKQPDAYPAVWRHKPPKRGKSPTEPRGPIGVVTAAMTGLVRQALPVRETSRHNPEAAVPAMDLRWWLLSQFDSAVVSSADGTGASWYKRDRTTFVDLMSRSVALHQELLQRWDELCETYRGAVPELTGVDAWLRTWHIDPTSLDETTQKRILEAPAARLHDDDSSTDQGAGTT